MIHRSKPPEARRVYIGTYRGIDLDATREGLWEWREAGKLRVATSWKDSKRRIDLYVEKTTESPVPNLLRLTRN